MIIRETKQIQCSFCGAQHTIYDYEGMTGWWGIHWCPQYGEHLSICPGRDCTRCDDRMFPKEV